ncbi:hypothetical protein ACFCP7_00370 [Paenibacillus elgii]
MKDRAKTYCEFLRPDASCALMAALATESDPRCKLWRDPPADCRYLRLVVTKQRR